MIKIENLTKSFKKKRGKRTIAVDHIALHIKKGETFGFIGLNGAGKTTTLKMLSGLILPDEGTATINGYDIVKDSVILKKKVGLLAGEFARSFYWRLTGRQNLKFFANLRDIWHPNDRINELLKLFDLEEFADEPGMKYSTGMKHKLALCVGLLYDPEILFLDEPLTGIDPATAFKIKNLIRTKFKEKTIIWASHNLYEIEEMCDRIALIHKGKIVFQGTPEELKEKYCDHIKIFVDSDKAYVFALLLPKTKIHNNIAEIKTTNIKESFHKINEIAREKNIEIRSIRTSRKTLEEIFLEIVNRQLPTTKVVGLKSGD